MEIYLIRHTTPAIEKGICYGQTDLDVTDSFQEEVNSISCHLPKNIQTVYSSPLQRCRKLAEALFPDHPLQFSDYLMELNCGNWEMQLWNEIPKSEIQPWLNDFVNLSVPNGESYVQMHERVVTCFESILEKSNTAAIVAHGGVLRSILSHITHTPLKDSFDQFTCHYGSVVKLNIHQDSITFDMLYNVSRAGREWHRPDAEL